MKFSKSAKMAAASILATALLIVIILSVRNKGFDSIEVIDLLQYFIFIPLLTFVFYYMFSKKFDEFNKRFERIEKQFDRMTSKLESEERSLVGEEKTLRSEISDLKTAIKSLDKSIIKMKAK
ncbi:hypothetical protein H0N95_01810 [Candidatus Micrarchaeota archaeon]|nr:hypothetical protein [Candidatus Micrarchaeota archaeon]